MSSVFNIFRLGYRRWSKYPNWYKIPWLLLGELPGSLRVQHISCGKPYCKFSTGRQEDKLPAYYRFWRDDAGKLRKAYVKRSELERVREAIERRNAKLGRQRKERNKYMRGVWETVYQHITGLYSMEAEMLLSSWELDLKISTFIKMFL